MATKQEIREANKKGKTFEEARKDEKLLRAAKDHKPSKANPKARDLRNDRKPSVTARSKSSR